MGAVAALLFAQSPLYAPIRPATLVLDSPFCSFPKLVDDLIKKGALKIPRIAVNTVLSMVRASVKKRTGADVYKLEPIKGCTNAHMPALFVTADRDEMIPVEHGAALNAQWGGPSMQVEVAEGMGATL
jgi:pimeloyl-ACP methyl ester carboxylesterase